MTVSNTTLLVAADTTVDLYPLDGMNFEPGSDIRWVVGGTGANVAIGVGLYHENTALMTNVGADVFGTQAAKYLEQSPVATQYLTEVDAPSPLTLYVPKKAGGPRWDAWIDESCFGFTLPQDISAAFKGTDWLYLSGTTLPKVVNWMEINQLLNLAAKHGVKIAFDLNGRANQWPDTDTYRARIETVLPHCDVVFASEEDLSLAGVTPKPDDVLPLLSTDGSFKFFVTRGAESTTCMSIVDGHIHQKTSANPPTVDVYDSAGAGDAFAAGVLAALFTGEPDIEELLAVGNAAGAAAVTSPGSLRYNDISKFEKLID